MERIVQVVRRGKVITSDQVLIGKLIYRNDDGFLRQKRLIIRLAFISAFISFIIVLLCLFVIIFYGFGFPFIIFFFAFFINTLIYLISYNNWKSIDHGIGVHENGLDAFEIRSTSIPRIFIPYEEIGLLKVGWIRFTIHLRSSKKKFFCSSKMVDVMTIRIAEELRRGERPQQEQPQLVVYGDEGSSFTTRF